jgi:hypothetical protein
MGGSRAGIYRDVLRRVFGTTDLPFTAYKNVGASIRRSLGVV